MKRIQEACLARMAIYKIYCDESRQDSGTHNRYMLIGGIWIQAEEGWNFVNDFEGFCSSQLGLHKQLGHMKWEKVPSSPSTIFFRAYKHLVDLYFQYNVQGKMFFRTIIVDKTRYDFTHPLFYGGDYEEGFYNIYCQLILNWLRKGNEYHIRIAKRNVRKTFSGDCEQVRLKRLKEKLNTKFIWRLNKYRDIYGFRNVDPPVKTIESRPARTRRLIQLADLLTGAVGFYWNEHDTKPDHSLGKTVLAKHIALMLGRSDLRFATHWRDMRFNIFFLDLPDPR